MLLARRILILSWALAASLLTLFLIGFSHIYSSLFGEAHVLMAFDVSFILFTVIYTLVFWRILKRPLPIWVTFLAFLPPFAIFWLILAP